jgi:hypothetical protein
MGGMDQIRWGILAEKLAHFSNMLNEGVIVPMLSSDQEAAVGTTEAGACSECGFIRSMPIS